MTVLIDTHALLWLASDHPRATPGLRSLLAGASERYVSSASAFEIAMKVRLGKLPGGGAVLDGWSRLLRNLQVEELPLSVAHMARAGGLEWTHRDPFDRMLVAQAQLEGLALLTDDVVVRAYPNVRTRWA